ncbi:neutral zinc metallopeptidase [Nonomuraea sp. NPDC050310]|uniref:neutral zinc metallopeptidase n=1 Tax=unclassified Nonomuraea TaxID=2593643 RepID=UPI0033F930D8
MRNSVKALVCGVALALSAGLTGGAAQAASADPIPKVKALIANPIYRVGAFPLKTCEEGRYSRGDVAGAQAYLEGLLDCLNTTWSKQFKKAGLKFKEPKFAIAQRIGDPIGRCGKIDNPAMLAVYCHLDQTFTVLLNPDALLDPDDMTLMGVLAHEYGHHVQNQAGIWKAYAYGKYTDNTWYEISRRTELQADCWAGAFIGSVWPSLGRSKADFKDMAEHELGGTSDAVTGYGNSPDLITGSPTHGRLTSQRYWLYRGFTKPEPGSCNTWTASKKRVA